MYCGDCVKATKEMVHAVRASKELAERYEKIAAGETSLKQYCPILLPNGISQTGSRLNKDMVPTGNFFIDYDEKGNGWEILWNKVKDHLEEWGILLVEKSARGGGHMIVKRQPNTTIQADIKSWEEKLGLTFDNVHDYARAMFLVPETNVLYESDELYADTCYVENECADSDTTLRQISVVDKDEQKLYDDFVGNKEEWARNYTITMETFCEKNVKVRDVALKYLEVKGYNHDPEKGEDGNRHNFYVDMAKGCKKLADAENVILLVQLPSLGLSVKERIKIILSITKVCTSTIPHNFFCFLRDNGFIKDSGRGRYDKNGLVTEEQKERTFKAIQDIKKVPVPSFIPFPFKPYIDCCVDEDYKEAMLFSLVPVMYLLRPRIRIPLDGDKGFGRGTKRYDYCLSQTIILGPAACGKSFVKNVVDDLTVRLKTLDDAAQKETRAYQESVAAAKYNPQHQPRKDRMKVAMRMIPARTSPPALLEMQEEARGLSQLFFCEELDTLSKAASDSSNSTMSINDILRVAFNGGEYSQRFMNKDTFQGKVNIFLNVLATGTYDQLGRMFTQVTNGLVTRYNFCEMPEKWDGETPEYKPFRQRDIKLMNEFIDDCFAHTYKDEQGRERVEWYDVDVSWAHSIFENWKKQKIQQAGEMKDYSTRAFCPRVADMMNRLLAFIRDCYKDEKKFNKDKNGILKFCFYYGECSLRTMLQLFGAQYNEANWHQNERRVLGLKPQGNTILDNLPEVFDKDDVEKVQQELGNTTSAKIIISKLKARNKIKPVAKCKGIYMKI